MSYYRLQPNGKIGGEVDISGSKNSSLPILAASLLVDGDCILYNIPKLSDTENMLELLKLTNANILYQEDDGVKISATNIDEGKLPVELVNKLRASFLIIAPLLARCKRIRIPLPGGCPIGARPIDLHLKGFSAMGAKIKQGHGYVELKCDKLNGARIYLDFPSVGATENLMTAAASIADETIIENAANEPEIVDLSSFLCEMGAEITGAGTDTIRIKGKTNLSPVKHTIIPDRIEAGTFMAIAAITKSKLTINKVIPDHLKPVTAKLNEMGFCVNEAESSIEVIPCDKFKTVDIKTLPYPGFPTDMQSQFMSLMSVAEGTGIVVETIFENRFMHVPELLRMGAKIKIDGRTAVIDGTRRLSGAKVRATDLRAGAALVIAALAAQGESEIYGVEHIERGYMGFEEKLLKIGVNIKREKENQ